MGTQEKFEHLAHHARVGGKLAVAALFATMADVFDTFREDEPYERYAEPYSARLTEILPACDPQERALVEEAIAFLDAP